MFWKGRTTMDFGVEASGKGEAEVLWRSTNNSFADG
jgi:hypothetical protein